VSGVLSEQQASNLSTYSYKPVASVTRSHQYIVLRAWR
jgi:hypothetical protein